MYGTLLVAITKHKHYTAAAGFFISSSTRLVVGRSGDYVVRKIPQHKHIRGLVGQNSAEEIGWPNFPARISIALAYNNQQRSRVGSQPVYWRFSGGLDKVG